MPVTKSTIETEIKLRLADADSGRRLLADHGFQLQHPRELERNTLFDTPDRLFRRERKLIRLREFGPEFILCFKGTAQEGLHKTREELEVQVSDLDIAFMMLQRLGFEPTFVYEKYRSEYMRPGEAGVVMLDETIVGSYLELEGTDEWIDRTAADLGFQEADYLTASYGRLYMEHCQKLGIPEGNMTFEEAGA